MMEEDTTTAKASETKVTKKPKAGSKKNDDGAASKDTKKGTMLDQVCEAIENVGLPRKGASAKAIKHFIFDKHEYEESMHKRVNTLINQAFDKGIEKGRLVRPAVSKDSVGATGRFMLAEKTVKQKVQKKPIARKAEPEEHVSESEATPAKPRKIVRKRNLSDGDAKVLEEIGKTKSGSVKPRNLKAVAAKIPKKNAKAEAVEGEKNDIKTAKTKIPKINKTEAAKEDSESGVKATKAKNPKNVKTETAKRGERKNAKATTAKNPKNHAVAETTVKKGEKNSEKTALDKNSKPNGVDIDTSEKEETGEDSDSEFEIGREMSKPLKSSTLNSESNPVKEIEKPEPSLVKSTTRGKRKLFNSGEGTVETQKKSGKPKVQK